MSGWKVRNPAATLDRRDWIVAVLLFALLSSVYFATASGITSSNDGSHYALLRTVIANRTFELRQFDDYAEGNDIAITADGRLFSDRPPGTALLGTPFYVVGTLLPGAGQDLPSRHDAGNPALRAVMILPAWAGAATVVVLYGMMRAFGLGAAAAFSAAIMFGLGTAHWKYSSVLFSHALSGFLVITAVALALGLARQIRRGWAPTLLLGLSLGLAVLTEYSNALLVLILCSYVLWYQRPRDAAALLRSGGLLVLGGGISALFLLFYNQVNFGSPLRLSYSYAINYPWASSFQTTFNFPLAAGLQGLLVWGNGEGWCDPTCFNQGIFLLSPILLLALPGWYLFYRRAPREMLLTGLIFLVYLLLFARHRTFHGFTADGRYLVPYLGLLVVPLGFTLSWIYDLRLRPVSQAALLFIAYGLFYISLGNMVLHIGTSYNYTLDLAAFPQPFFTPQNWQRLLSQIFPNAANLPLLWLIELALLLFLLVLRRIGNSRAETVAAADDFNY